MPLLLGYEEIKSRAFYHVHFEIGNNIFSMAHGIEDPQEALDVIKEIKSRGYKPKFYRIIRYNSTKSGFLTKKPECQDLSIKRLEEIIRMKEPNPVHLEPIVSGTIIMAD